MDALDLNNNPITSLPVPPTPPTPREKTVSTQLRLIYLFTQERIPPFTAGVNPTLADQSTDDTLAGYSTVIDIIK